MARTLLGLGLKLPNTFEIVLTAIESGNMTMFDLVASSGVTIDVDGARPGSHRGEHVARDSSSCSASCTGAA